MTSTATPARSGKPSTLAGSPPPATTSPATTGAAAAAGGTAYGGTIVPSQPQPGQVTEAEFLRGLADRMYDRLPKAAPHGDSDRDQDVAMLRTLVESSLRRVVGEHELLDRWLRHRLGFSDDRSVPVEDFYEAITRRFDLSRFDAERLLELGLQVESALAQGTETTTYPQTSAREEGISTADFLFGAVIFYIPPDGGKPLKLTRNEYAKRVGNRIHLILQAHYWWDHPSDVMMFEDFLVVGRRSLGTIYQLGRLFTEWARLRIALGGRTAPGTDTRRIPSKRPDILNLTRKLVYEIKPVAERQEGERQVDDYVRRSQTVDPSFQRGGAGDWRPFPVYATGLNTVAVAWLDHPGLILYERYEIPPQVLQILAFWKLQKELEKQYRQRTSNVDAAPVMKVVAVLLIIALLLVLAWETAPLLLPVLANLAVRLSPAIAAAPVFAP